MTGIERAAGKSRDYEEILYSVGRGVGLITLNRPERLNAWTTLMERELRHALGRCVEDSEVRAIVLTGAGKGFCAGADTGGLESMVKDNKPWGGLDNTSDTLKLDTAKPDFKNRLTYFPAIPKPIIAAVNGTCAGVGFVLSLYCDLRFASDNANFVSVFARRGLVAENGVAWLLSRLVGPSRALDVLMSSRKIGAAEALSMGMVNRIVAPDDLIEAAQEYGRDLGTKVSPRSVRVIKRQIWESQLEGLQDSVSLAETETAMAIKSEDFQEGVKSFLENRPAKFTGQ